MITIVVAAAPAAGKCGVSKFCNLHCTHLVFLLSLGQPSGSCEILVVTEASGLRRRRRRSRMMGPKTARPPPQQEGGGARRAVGALSVVGFSKSGYTPLRYRVRSFAALAVYRELRALSESVSEVDMGGKWLARCLGIKHGKECSAQCQNGRKQKLI